MRRASQGEQFAEELKTVLDSAFVGSLRSISTSPEGTSQPGLPADHQRVGTLSVDDSEVDVILTRVSDPNAGKIWLFSADTIDFTQATVKGFRQHPTTLLYGVEGVWMEKAETAWGATSSSGCTRWRSRCWG